MKYRIGQKVVFIGPDMRGHPLIVLSGLNVPLPKQVYTIRGGMECHPCGGENAYLLEEVRNRTARCLISGWVGEMHVNEGLLRPVTDISLFEQLRKDIEAGNCDLVRDKVGA